MTLDQAREIKNRFREIYSNLTVELGKDGNGQYTIQVRVETREEIKSLPRYFGGLAINAIVVEKIRARGN